MMSRKHILLVVLLFVSVPAWSQELDNVPAELVGYPEMVLLNGKIVAVDDHSFTSQLGTIAEAMAIRDGKVLAVGGNDRLGKLVGPETKVIDLKGRMVLPGLISVHDHPYDWIYKHAETFQSVVRGDSVVISRFFDSPPDQQLKNFETTLSGAVKEAKPGQWIFISLFRGKHDEWKAQMSASLGAEINRSQLDRLAPNNPVAVVATSLLLNS